MSVPVQTPDNHSNRSLTMFVRSMSSLPSTHDSMSELLEDQVQQLQPMTGRPDWQCTPDWKLWSSSLREILPAHRLAAR